MNESTSDKSTQGIRQYENIKESIKLQIIKSQY